MTTIKQMGTMRHLRFRSTVWAIAALACTLTLAGCANGTETEESVAPDDEVAAPEEGLEPLDIVFVSTYNGLPFYNATYCGMKAAAEDLGGEISYRMEGPPVGMNVAQQLPVLESVIQTGPDGLVLVPADPQALIPTIEEARAAGIAVTTTDVTPNERVDIASFVADNYEGGRMAGEKMLDLLDGAAGKVLIIDIQTGLPVTNQRAEGFADALEGSALEVLDVQYNQNDPSIATEIVEASLRTHEDLVAIFATAEAAANGTTAALQGLADPVDVRVVAYDSGPVLIRALREGTLDALVGQGSFEQGYRAMEVLVRYLRGELSEDEVEYPQSTPNAVLTLDNVDDPDVVAEYHYPASADTCE